MAASDTDAYRGQLTGFPMNFTLAQSMLTSAFAIGATTGRA